MKEATIESGATSDREARGALAPHQKRMAVALGTAERREWTVPPPEAAMWRHQAALPLLPVPDLGQTCVRYLRSVRPLLTDAEFEKTLGAVAAFAVGGQGGELQRRLRARRGEKRGSSWLADWWNHLAYLSDPGYHAHATMSIHPVHRLRF